MIGLGPHEMSAWAWFLMAAMTIFWVAMAVAVVYIAVRMTRGDGR